MAHETGRERTTVKRTVRGHRHTCLGCGRVIGRVGPANDCEANRSHDWGLCESCAIVEAENVAGLGVEAARVALGLDPPH